MKKTLHWIVFILAFYVPATLAAISVFVYSTDANKKPLGTVLFEDTQYGLLIKPDLQHLPPGLHGFHVHEHPDCGDHGQNAGGHLDPQTTGKHLGPYNDKGHLGDLPALYVDQKGNANLPLIAPRLKIQDIAGHSLMIHEGGDNYSDVPEKLGGGGARIGCGPIKN